MKLLTKAIEKKLAKYPLYSQDGKKEKEVIVKFFHPWKGWRWYVTEGELNEDGDWLFFGLVEGFEKEWGYFTLSELMALNNPIPVERDKYFEGKKINMETNEIV